MTALRQALQTAQPRLVSVDLFDTLLLRGTRPEFCRFADVARLQHQNLGTASPGSERLFEARLRHTRQAYAAVRAIPGGSEVSFESILAALCGEFGLATHWVADFVQLELAYEIRHLTPNRRLVAELIRLEQGGVSHVIVSDTPLRGADLKVLLSALVPELVETVVLSSADEKRTKRDGGLFDVLVARMGFPPGEILHIGDNPHSDAVMARCRGLQAVLLPRPRWWRLVHGLRARYIRNTLQSQGLIP